MPDTAELACIVLCLRDPPEVVDAVRSLTQQTEQPEILVVNSGGGDPLRRLRASGLDVRVVNTPEPLLPGAARNLGIRSTSARFVSFLASDCLAGEGWVAGRLREHRAGAEAVAAVLTNADPANLSARAAFLLLHHRMSRHARGDGRLLYGISYDRSLFARFGLFREDLRAGEDTEFNGRITGSARVTWCPDVCTAHRNPLHPIALLRDQYARGRRRATAEAILAVRARRAFVAAGSLLNAAASLRYAWCMPDRHERASLLRAWPLVPLGALAYALGALLASSPAGDAGPINNRAPEEFAGPVGRGRR